MNAIAVPESVTVGRPDPILIQSAEEFLTLARASYAGIATAEQFEAAGEDLKSLKIRQKQLEDARIAIARPLLDVQRAVNALFRAPQQTLDEAERIIKTGMLTYQVAQERKQREAEAAAAEALRKEREKLEALAVKAESSGRPERADALRLSAAQIPERVELAATAPRVQGISSRSTWRAEAADLLLLVKFIAQHPEWLHLVEVNVAALNGLARSQRSALSIPGVRVVEEKQVTARAT